MSLTKTSAYETVDRIRRTHRHAQPNPAENPAWANCHMDCGILLAEIDRLHKLVMDLAHCADTNRWPAELNWQVSQFMADYLTRVKP